MDCLVLVDVLFRVENRLIEKSAAADSQTALFRH